MKRLLSLIVGLVLVGVLLATGCGGAKETGQSEKATQPAETTAPTSPPEAAGDWKNIPIYPGAKATEKYSVSLPLGAELKDIDYRFYESKTKVEQVASFYQTEMPKRGWDGSFITGSDFAMGNYQKDDGKTIAVVMLNLDDGMVKIVLASGTKK